MHRCTCPTRALELFVKDLSGLNLRQRTSPHSLQRLARNFGSSRKQLEAGQIASTESGIRGSKRLGSSNVTSLDALTGDGAKGKESTIDHTSFRPIHAALSSTAPEKRPIIASALSPSPSPGSKPSGSQEIGPSRGSRKATRLLRKERRIWEGKYKPLAQQKPLRSIGDALSEPTTGHEVEGVSGDVQPVLEIMDKKLQEPSIVKQQNDKSPSVGDASSEPTAGQESDTVQRVLEKIDKELQGPSIVKQQNQIAARKAKKSEAKKKHAQTTRAKRLEEDRKKEEEKKREREGERRKAREAWAIQKEALERKFGDQGWQPRKRVSPDSLEGIRALHASDPRTYTTQMLSQHFAISPDAVRRILKSKWRPSEEEVSDRMGRWEKRGVRKWKEMAELGMKPPKKWRQMGVPNPNLERKKKWEDRGGGGGGGGKTGEVGDDCGEWQDPMGEIERTGRISLATRI